MSELFTDEQIDFIDAALVRIGEPQAAKSIRAELAPKQEFAEGQVVATNYGEIPRYNQIIGINKNLNKDVNLSDDRFGGYYEHGRDVRSLNQTEVGPGWVPFDHILIDETETVPRAEFEKLLDVLLNLVHLKNYKDNCGKDSDYLERQPKVWAAARDALDSLPENLKPEDN